jgi:hypothetical protein
MFRLRKSSQHLETIHHWHFQIKGQDIGLEHLDLGKRKLSVRGRTNDFDAGHFRKRATDQLPVGHGIINDENSNIRLVHYLFILSLICTIRAARLPTVNPESVVPVVLARGFALKRV